MTKITLFKSATDVLELEPGDVVFREGDPGDVMYAVIEGAVDIVHGGTTIESVEPGGVFGELSLVDHSPRGATVVATAPSRLARVDERDFMFLVQEHPTFALQVMKILAERLRLANDR
jgi:CRP/FNR family cyclic AMP-dependent transcriptional regulator